jgi:hypothetical protein
MFPPIGLLVLSGARFSVSWPQAEANRVNFPRQASAAHMGSGPARVGRCANPCRSRRCMRRRELAGAAAADEIQTERADDARQRC